MQDRKVGVWALLEQHSPSSDACDVKVCRFWLIACLACGPQLVYHQVHTKQAESLALWVCIYLWAERIASLQTFFSIAESCVMCMQSVNCPPCRSPDRECDYCPDGWRVARRSVLLCRTRSKSLLCLSKLIYVKPGHIYCWLHWLYGFALNGSSWFF